MESATCFAEAIDLAPQGERERVINESIEEIKKLSSAYIYLQADKFIKWPDEDGANGFINDINHILSAVKQLADKSGVLVSGIMEPVADIINKSVVASWSKKILPDYTGSDNHPSKYAFDQFIERLGFCTMLLEKAIGLSEEDDEQDIQRYENLIYFHNEAIKSCSWKQNYNEWGTSWAIDYTLTDSAKQARKDLISQYNNNLSQIKIRKQQQDEAERQNKERKVRDEAQKRYDEYWSFHTSEKSHFVREKNELSEQIINLEKERDTVSSPIRKENENIHARIAKMMDEQKTLGIFKGNEKKALQSNIASAQIELAANTSKVSEANKSITAKIEGLKALINEIDIELAKER